MIKKLIATAALAILTCAASAATTNTFYTGIDGGGSKINGLGDNEGSYGAFLGYNFHENFAVEIGARRLGSWNFRGADVDINQYAASIIGTLPLQNQFSLFARLGYNKLSADISSAGVGVNATDSGMLYGVGVDYNFTPTIAGRIEFQKPSSDSHNLSAGVSFQF